MVLSGCCCVRPGGWELAVRDRLLPTCASWAAHSTLIAGAVWLGHGAVMCVGICVLHVAGTICRSPCAHHHLTHPSGWEEADARPDWTTKLNDFLQGFFTL